MFQRDWVLRQINELANFISKIIFNKDTTDYVLAYSENNNDCDRLYFELTEMISKGQINEAENLLYEKLDSRDKKYLELAIDFYCRLNVLSDEFLEKCDFTREEIEEGLKNVSDIFGVPKI